MSTKFMITGNDLVDGEPENCQYCAVALAVARDIVTDLPNAENLVPNIDGDGNFYIQEMLFLDDGFKQYQDKYKNYHYVFKYYYCIFMNNNFI